MFKTSQSKSVWAQLGLGSRGRDADFHSVPTTVSEHAQAKTATSKAAPPFFEFAPQNRGQIPQRPSTSAGPDSSFTKRRNAEKRETKDDLHFNPLAAHGKGRTFYNFPLPGALPTPATTPRSSTPPPQKPFLVRPSTPDSMEIVPAPVNGEAEPMVIGMALGSPAHPPTIYQQDRPETSYAGSPSPDQLDRSVDGWAGSPPTLRRKPSRWKILGGIFGAKKNTQAFYQVQPEVPYQSSPEPEVVDSDEPRASSEKRPERAHGRGRANSERKVKKGKSETKMSTTAPLNFELADSNGLRNRTANPEIMLDGGPLNDNGQTKNMPYNHQGFLDVDIPSIHMERYSVMFSGVLQKTSQTSSSLLARRQATLDKLKTVNEALASKERELEARARLLRPRRATSPQPTKSPAFSLFPSTPSRTRESSPHRTPNLQPSLQRSNTSPAALSPSRPAFAPGPENEAHARLLANAPSTSISENQSTSPVKSLRKNEPKQSPKPTGWSPEESRLSLDSDVEQECEVEDIYDPVPFPMKPKLAEPTWQMVAPPVIHSTPSSTSDSTAYRSDHSASTSASSISSPPSASFAPNLQMTKPIPVDSSNSEPLNRAVTISQPTARSTRLRSATTTAMPSLLPRRIPNEPPAVSFKPASHSSTGIANHHRKNDNPKDEDEEARLKTAADVSIARQISLSRQQRQLLVPIKSSLKNGGSKNLTENRPVGGRNFSIPSAGTGSKASEPQRIIGAQNFPTPSSGIGIRVASPLGAVAVAAQEERARAASPLAEKVDRPGKEKRERPERLVEGVKLITPTLVVVGEAVDKNEKAWRGATQTAKSSPVSLGDRGRAKDGIQYDNYGSGEIRVVLAPEHGSRDLQFQHAKDLQHRKSERVVVERISVASN